MENQNNEHTDPWDMTENIYEILANDLSGEPLSTEEARLFEASAGGFKFILIGIKCPFFMFFNRTFSILS